MKDTTEESFTLEEVFPEFAGREKQVYLRGIRYREDLTQKQLADNTSIPRRVGFEIVPFETAGPKQLADNTGIPQRHISEMENGKRPIGKENAKKLAKVLNCDYRLML